MEEGLFHNPAFVNYINEFAVAAIGHQGSHGEVEQFNPHARKKQKNCPHYNTIPCSAHQAVASGAQGLREGNGMPQSYVTDHTGKKISKVGRSPGAVTKALQEAQQKIGKKPITGSMLRKMEAGLYKGDKALKKLKFKKALKAYQKVKDGKKTPAFIKKKAEARIAGLQEAALAAIQEAQGSKKAKATLKKLLKELKDLPEAKKACEEALKEAK